MELKQLLSTYYNAIVTKNEFSQSIIYTRLIVMGYTEKEIMILLKKEFKDKIIIKKLSKKKNKK
jgi:hypothetical protein